MKHKTVRHLKRIFATMRHQPTLLFWDRTSLHFGESVLNRLYKKFWQYFYHQVADLIKDSPVTFLNYGYIDSETNQIPLQAADEPDRVFIQLYHHLVGEINLKGLDVLEVSCAHGGGAAYIGRYLKPRSVLGVDFNVKAVDFCRGHFSIEEFAFACGDAESLQFADNTFDVIVNVEASHCYGDMVRFLGEVVRLLRPGGYFLFADFRPTALADTLHEQFIQSGLELVKRKDITPNVLKAMELDSQRRLGLVKELVPRLFQGCAEQVVGIKGSRMFEAFRVGTMVYLSYILRKVDAPI